MQAVSFLMLLPGSRDMRELSMDVRRSEGALWLPSGTESSSLTGELVPTEGLEPPTH